MRTIISVDQSFSGTGICALDIEAMKPVHLETIKTDPKRTQLMRIADITNRLMTVVGQFQPIEMFTLEEPTRLAQSAAIIPLAELYGAIRIRMYLLGYQDGLDMFSLGCIRSQNQSTMKKFALGDGGRSKDSGYLLAVMEATGIKFTDDNQADAYMHAITACAGYRIAYGLDQPSKYNPKQLSALTRVPEPKLKKMTDESIRELLLHGSGK